MKQSTQSSGDLPKLAAPARRALVNAGITSLKQLATISEEEVTQLHGMGKNAVAALREALSARGRSFRKGKNGGMDKKIRAQLDNIFSDRENRF